MKDQKYHQTYFETPHGGILSTISTNVYLNERDKKIEEIKNSFDKKYKKEYQLLTI